MVAQPVSHNRIPVLSLNWPSVGNVHITLVSFRCHLLGSIYFFSWPCCPYLLARVLCAGNCNDALGNVGDSQPLVPSSAQAMDAIDNLRCFAGSHEGDKRALHAVAKFESHAWPLTCANTRRNRRLFQKLRGLSECSVFRVPYFLYRMPCFFANKEEISPPRMRNIWLLVSRNILHTPSIP